jgi:fatty-acyl-CoA synthase
MCSSSLESSSLSFASGPRAAVWEKTIGQVLRETRARSGARDALIDRHQGLRYSWDQLIVECERIAAGLFALGIQPGDRVGIWSTNCAEWVMLQYACALSGIILVNVNPAYRSHELRYVLDRSRIRVLFLHERDQRANYRDILNHSIEGVDCALERAIYLGTRDWQAMLDAGEPYVQPVVMTNDVANIQYTSGTTGSPKGVLLTHRNLINDGRFIAERLRYTDQDRICLPVPLYHCFGCVIGTMSAAATGAAIILPAPTFDARLTLEAIHTERATSVYGVPTMFIAELSHADFPNFDYTSLRTGVMAGSPCPIEVMRRVVNEMHCPEITICYGQTECSPVNVMSSTDDTLELRCSTVGSTMPATEIRIANPSTNETVARGQVGELRCKGFLVMKGYDADPDATRGVFDPDGWLCSGDLAVMRDDGYIRITGRLKDMILRGGENIYPREIEEFLYTNPKIADVQVIGIPDQRLGEVVSAWVVLKPGQTATEEEIKAFCQGKIAYFKIPSHVRLVDAFPLTVTGKVQKFRMREIEIEERGLENVANTATA